jgi:hypothetical protein
MAIEAMQFAELVEQLARKYQHGLGVVGFVVVAASHGAA